MRVTIELAKISLLQFRCSSKSGSPT
jgi:hypothetical protein